MRLIIFGAPGVGKGTQAKILAKELGILHVCSGDLLRQAVKEVSPLGKQAKGFMEKGELVPDKLVSQLILDRLNQPDVKKGFILDGYPRNIHQAVELDKMLETNRQKVDAVIYLEASEEVIIQRLAGRRLCSACQANFHIKNMPPKKKGICDYCGASLYRRPDDNEETIRNRLKIYRDATVSLIDYYKKKNILLRVWADQEADVVMEKILTQMKDGHLKIPARD